MSILGPKFASALWCLKRYRKEIELLDVSEKSKEILTTNVDDCIEKLQKIQTKFTYRRAKKANE